MSTEKKNSYNKIITRSLTAQKKTRKLADMIEEDARKNKEVYEKPLTREFATSVQKAACELSRVNSRSFVLENIELLYNRNIKAIAARNDPATKVKRKKPVTEDRKLEIKAALSRGVSVEKIQNLFPEFTKKSINEILTELRNERDKLKEKVRKVRTRKTTGRNGSR